MIDDILEKSHSQLVKIFKDDTQLFYDAVHSNISPDDPNYIQKFIKLYNDIIKRHYQLSYKYDQKLYNNITNNPNKIKIVWGDSLNLLKKLPNESIQLIITSPPYYNARDYSTWDNLNDYIYDMKNIIQESFRVLDNHRMFILNISDIFGNDIHNTSNKNKRRIPLTSYFIKIFEDCKFTYIDDYIWDKGQVQSQRHKNKPYPFYQYPINCYEHIIVFTKHRLDKTPYPCPECGYLTVNNNGQNPLNVQSWECKNTSCTAFKNRGKRFSTKTYLYNNTDQIDYNTIKKWQRDIVQFSPVIKINNKGENKLGHTAPFPKDIPNMAVKFFSHKGDNILDPFAGSFTVPIVANQLGRNGIGVEIRDDLFSTSIISNIKQYNIQYEQYTVKD